ncbi:MAG TPA: carbohydrate kinase family protein [Clostridiales bacterium]|nr:carbohydrate kinase family protein [Clostridiales bacterium]
MHKVIVVGDAVVDIIVPYPKLLNEERTRVEYPVPCIQGGGTAANTAVALSRLEIPTGFIGTIGDDQYGRYIVRDFKNECIDTEQLIIESDLNTVGVFAFIDETGERYLWGWPRVDQAFKVLDMSKINMETIHNASWIHSSGMAIVHDTSARSSIIRIFKEAYKRGIPTSFDLNLRVDQGSLDEKYKEAVLEVIKYSSYVLGSADEEFRYLGDSEDPIENARAFVNNNRTVIARLGKQGSYGLSVDEEVIAEAFNVEVVDTVGAGDVYNAGFIAAVLQGCSLKDSLIIGNAVSGYTVGQKGARNCPHKDELNVFLKKHNSDVAAGW